MTLFTQLSGSASDHVPSRAAETVSEYYRHVHGPGSDPRWFGIKNTSTGTELLARRVWASQYRNGSYTSQSAGPDDPLFGEAADLERTDARSLNVFWPGQRREKLAEVPVEAAGAVLTAPLGTDDTQVHLGVVPPDRRPAGTGDTWPFVASRDAPLADAHSRSTASYVSWLRVGGELMKIVAPPMVSGSTVVLQVARGLWSTEPAPHAAGSKVLAPVYIGSGFEGAGYPGVGDAAVALRYSAMFWRPKAYRWLADRILMTLGDGRTAAEGGRLEQYDTVWLDNSTCRQYNLSDALGHRVWSWDLRTDRVMSEDAWGGYQAWKLNGRKNRGGGLRDLLLHADPGTRVRLVGNNFDKIRSSCDRKLAWEYDAVVLEHWQRDPARFRDTMREAFRYQRLDFPALFWVRWDRRAVPTPMTDAFQRYTYGAYLLAWDPAARRPQFGMTWGWSAPHALFRTDGDPATDGDLGVPRKPGR